MAPSSPDVLYAAVYNDAEGATAEGLLLYRSDDGAESWRRLDATGASCHWQCWYDLTLAVHPNDPDRVNLGTIYMYLSEDGGQTFRTQHPPDIHVDQHFLVYDTLSGSDVLYLANDGGVFRSTDAGISFTSLSTNLAITQFYAGIDLHPADPEVALGGTQDQGTQRSSPGTATWARILGGDGGHTAFDDEDPEVWYAETQWIAGADYIGPRKNGSLAVNGIDRNERGLFIPPLVMDPVDSRRLYFGTRRLYTTDDAAETWTPVFETSRGVITAIAPALSDPLTVYVAVGGWVYAGGGGGGYGTDGLIAVTRDGGATWSRSSQGLPERYVADLSVHPTDPDRAYAVLGGFLSGHVFGTTDGGRTWQDRSGNLPDMPVNAVLHDPADPAGVYVGTDLGVFHSATGGGAWTPLRDGFPSVAVFDLAAQPGTGRLVAATHGRGMFEIPIEIPLLAQVRPWTVTDTVFAGVDTVAVGDVIVAPRGRGDYAAAWNVATSGEPWLSLSDADGVGRGRFEYRIAGVDLVHGDHPATITVATAGTDPVVIPVNVHARRASTIAASRTGHRTAVPVGHAQPIADSLRVTFSGPLADATAWNAVRRGAGWADLIVASGGRGWRGDVVRRRERAGRRRAHRHAPGPRGGRRKPGDLRGHAGGGASLGGDCAADGRRARRGGPGRGTGRIALRRTDRIRCGLGDVDGHDRRALAAAGTRLGRQGRFDRLEPLRRRSPTGRLRGHGGRWRGGATRTSRPDRRPVPRGRPGGGGGRRASPSGRRAPGRRADRLSRLVRQP